MPLTATEPRRAHTRQPVRRTASIASSTASGATRRTRAWRSASTASARNGRDFDVLAEALAPTHRVLAVDMPGRGESEWLADPSDYGFPTYLTTLTALIARSGAEAVDWVGTSMGGLLGMAIAAQPRNPIARLVVNDVGTGHRAGGAGAHRHLRRARPDVREPSRRSSATSARSPRPSARSPMRSGAT